MITPSPWSTRRGRFELWGMEGHVKDGHTQSHIPYLPYIRSISWGNRCNTKNISKKIWVYKTAKPQSLQQRQGFVIPEINLIIT